MDPRHKAKKQIICKCNNVPRSEIEQAIREGCHSMNEIFDATTAGVGACGGSCRRYLQPMLDHYLKTGEFPAKIIPDMTGKIVAPPLKKDDE